MLAPIMPHLAEEAFYNSHLREKYPNGLFRSNLKVYSDAKWSNTHLEKVFQLVNRIREDFNEKVGSGNVALFEAELKLDSKGAELVNSVHIDPSWWLTEIFGCSNVEFGGLLGDDESECRISECGIKYRIKVSQINREKKFSCVRCRRYVSCEKDGLCERCKEVLKI